MDAPPARRPLTIPTCIRDALQDTEGPRDLDPREVFLSAEFHGL